MRSLGALTNLLFIPHPSPSPELSDYVRFLSSVQFSRSVVSNSLRPHELQHARPPCPSPNPGVYSNSCPWSRCYSHQHPLFPSMLVQQNSSKRVWARFRSVRQSLRPTLQEDPLFRPGSSRLRHLCHLFLVRAGKCSPLSPSDLLF